MSSPNFIYTPRAWETVPCPFCKSSEATIYERFGSELQYTYKRCNECSLIYQSPRPKYDQHFIDAAYAEYYQLSDNLELHDASDVPESSVQLFKSKNWRTCCNLIKKRTNVLDIGSGVGTFLYAAKPHYKKAVGLDVSAQMAAFVEKKIGVKVYLEQFDRFNYPEKFSLIHMSHVIEHVPNPNEWIEKAAGMLEEDGVLVVNVPNKYSFSFRLQHLFVKLKLKKQFSSSWSAAYRTPDHLFEPNVKSMLTLFEKHHFKVLDYFSYSRKDPASKKSFLSRFVNRSLYKGSNLSFITTPR